MTYFQRPWHRLLAFSLILFLASPIVSLQSAKAQDPGTSSTSTLGEVLKKGILRVGVSLFTPWTLKNKQDELVGFEVDVAKRLAKDLGVQVEIHDYEWEKILPALLNKKIDIIMAGMVITPQRALKVSFSQPYADSGIGLATNKILTKDFSGLKDLNHPDVILTAVAGTVADDLVRRIFPKATLKTFAKSKDAIHAITSGKVHGYIEHNPLPTFLTLDYPDKIDEPLSKPLLTTKAGFAINKGDPDFINFLNAWITAHQADTWLDSVHGYWFHSLEWRKEVGVMK